MNSIRNFVGKSAFLISSIVAVMLLFTSSCETTKGTTSGNTDVPKILYQSDILPIMQRSCTPCHFPENGRKKMLDTYDATKKNIDDILERIQMDPGNIKFMPFKSKREVLSAEEIALFQKWKAQGMGE